MGHRLPSVQSLLVLDAAVRHGNFSRAAEELSLTHGAVSQQIRSLQTRLGTRLFVRDGQAMRPTGACLALVAQVRQAVSLLDRAFELPVRRKASSGRLVLGVMPHFATGWLIPRLPQFARPGEDIVIDLVGSHVIDDLGQSGIDASIRFGPGQWPGVAAERLIGERAFPVCAPSLLPRARQGLETLDARDFLRSPFPPWEPWLQAAGVRLRAEPAGPHYSDPTLMLSAALMGQGVAMARSIIVNDDIRQGRLVRLHQTSVDEPYAYYLIWRPDTARRPLIRRFLEWLKTELEKTSGSCA
jgi:LysR family glycine cleavage system transcriptional activator